MARYLSSDEARQKAIGAFPEEIGALYHELDSSIAHLHLSWKDYRALFGTSPERIEVLNWAASDFFGLLDGILLSEVLLAIARLTDRPKTAGHDNASLCQLINRLKPCVDEATFADFRTKLHDLRDSCERIRDTRNRILAHSDLATKLGYHSDPAPGISRAYIESVLKRIRDLMNSVAVRFLDTEISYESVFAISGGEQLMQMLENAYKQSLRSQE